MSIAKNQIEFRNLNSIDENLLNKFHVELNSLINKSLKKIGSFEKLKFIVQGENDRQFGVKYIQKEKSIYIPSWLFFLTDEESSQAIFDFRGRVLLKEMIHFIDSELNFSGSEKFLRAMKQERIDTINYKIDSFFRLAYLSSFWINNESNYNNIATREQWEEMVQICNETYFRGVSPLMRTWQKWRNKNELKEKIPVKPAEKIIAKEYLFDLILAKNALEVIKNNKEARNKIERISDAWSNGLSSYCNHIKLHTEESVEDVFKNFIPKSYDCLLDFENRINGGGIKLKPAENKA